MKYFWEASDIRGGVRVRMYDEDWLIATISFADLRGQVFILVNLTTGEVAHSRGLTGERVAETLSENSARPLD